MKLDFTGFTRCRNVKLELVSALQAPDQMSTGDFIWLKRFKCILKLEKFLL